MNYYYSTDGTEVLGPCSLDELLADIQSGALPLTATICAEGQQDWKSIRTLIKPVSSAPKPTLVAGSYAAGTMQQDEKLIYQTSIHKIIFFSYIFKACVLPFVFFVFALIAQSNGDSSSGGIWAIVGLLFVCVAISATAAAITYHTSELLITNRRVIIKVGFISRRTIEIFISKIESVAVSQGIFGRLWNFGTVIIRGTGGSAEPFTMIAHPLEFRNYVQRIQSRTDA
jgi:membrane protein YdbS with pleckstrin-like domain